MKLREAERADHEALLDLWEALNRNGADADPRFSATPDARDQMRAWTTDSWFVRDPFPSVWVADEDGPVGFVYGFARSAIPVIDLEPTVRIGDLFVAPSFRGQGIARALVERMTDRAKAAGYPRAEVGTLTADARAVGFWRAMGFGDWQVTLAR